MKFENFIKKKINKKEVQEWIESFDFVQIKPSEKSLILDSYKLFSDYHKFPEAVFQIMKNYIITMSQGMQLFMKKKENSFLKLKNLLEVNQYCFYVAGIVGELLTEILSLCYTSVCWENKKIIEAYHFGLFLQKINLLKDQIIDCEEGRDFIYNRNLLYQSLKVHAIGAYKYLESIPLELKNYRLFCAWSLYIGLASLPVMQKGFKEGRVKKNSRRKTLLLVQKIKFQISDPLKMKLKFEKLLLEAGLNKDVSINRSVEVIDHDQAMVSYYNGKLSNLELSSLLQV